MSSRLVSDMHTRGEGESCVHWTQYTDANVVNGTFVILSFFPILWTFSEVCLKIYLVKEEKINVNVNANQEKSVLGIQTPSRS